MGYKRNFQNHKRRNLSRFPKKSRKKFKSEDENIIEKIPEQKNEIQDLSSEESSADDEISAPNSIDKLLATFGTSSQVESESENEESSDEDIREKDVADDDDDNPVADDMENDESEEDDESFSETHINEEFELSTDEDSSKDSISSANVEEDFDQIDPFQLHFENNIGKFNAEQVEDITKWSQCFHNMDTMGKVKVEIPSIVPVKKNFLLLDDDNNSNLTDVGVKIKHDLPVDLNKYFLKLQLINSISNSKEFESKSINKLQTELLSIITQYGDLYYPESTYEKWDDIRTIYSIHATNHILKTRKKIIHHNGKINRKKLQGEGDYNDLYRDQGFARPKVLILLPFKHSVFMVIKKIISLLFGDLKDGDVRHWKRFEEDFGPPEKSNEHINRPEDFKKIFDGDFNEDFKIGITITKKSLKLYTDFYNSDIIIGSPLGLRYTVGTKGEKDYNSDFLSSIEVLIMDHVDIFMMQNWEHVLVLMESLNNLPQDMQKLNTDLGRIRYWSLDGLSKIYRQTIMFAQTVVDHNRALFQKARNIAGQVQVLNHVKIGSVSEVVVPSELVLYKVNGVDADSRFNYFTQKFLPNWRTSHSGHTLLYIPDYCDYVRLVRYIKEDGGTNAATINEYMVGQNSKVAKARSLFFDGKRQILIYTERFHFYRRYRIKGVRHVVFYDLPTYPHFFPEICNLMVDGLQNSKLPPLMGSHQISCLYQSCSSRLIGVLGAERAAKVVSSTKLIHMCSIGS